VGGGHVGAALAALLSDGHEVTVIEERPEVAAAVGREAPRATVVVGNGADPDLLEAAGVRQAQVVAAVTGTDATNLVVAGLARAEYHVQRTVARVNDHHHSWLFVPAMGVDVALNQAEVMAHLIAEEMSLGEMLTLLKLRRGQVALVEERVAAGAPAVGQAVTALPLPPACAIVAIIRDREVLIPGPQLVLAPGDDVLAVVRAEAAAALASLLGGPASRPE
jgi:trk system potassium uptake protein TrkA